MLTRVLNIAIRSRADWFSIVRNRKMEKPVYTYITDPGPFSAITQYKYQNKYFGYLFYHII